MIARTIVLAISLLGSLRAAETAMEFPTPNAVRLSGLLGTALQATEQGRLSHFVVDENSPAIQLFSAEGRKGNTTGRYWGEHAGKWLYAAARGANRTGDPVLAEHVRRVADYLVSQQGPDGYLGTYPEKLRFTHPRKPDPKKEWDVWTMSYVMIGLMEVNRYFPNPAYVTASRRIADLFIDTFSKGGISILACGNHHGLSATILLDPAVDLYEVTGDVRYLDLAKKALDAAESEPAVRIVSAGLAGQDIQRLDDGKIYQIIWNLVGIAKLYRATGDARYLTLLKNDWESIRSSHLTLEGGPWGGVGVSREEFNPDDFFSPDGIVETCSTLSWIQLNRELLSATGEACYAAEIEKSAYNALLGAQDPNGEDWCYYTFPNGMRTNTGYWSCCKSSGCMALEEISPLAYSVVHGGKDIAVNLYGPATANLQTQAGGVSLSQDTHYPYAGDVTLTVTACPASPFAILLRIPDWSGHAEVLVNGASSPERPTAGSYLSLARSWKAGDKIVLKLPMVPVVHYATNRSLHGVHALGDEKPTELEVVREDYFGLTFGPLALATGPVDGFKHAETVLIPGGKAADRVHLSPSASAGTAPSVVVTAERHDPITFVPYFEAGGRSNGTWHLTWLQYASGL